LRSPHFSDEPARPPKPSGALGDRFWRLSAIFALCLLVYYFSYDHGRSSAKARLDREMAENQSLRLQLALRDQEIENFKVACSRLEPRSVEPDKKKPGPVNFLARVGEKKVFFGDRLILTVVDINNLDREAVVRLHFVEAAQRETTLVKVGESLSVNMDGQESQFFLDQLKGAVAFFSFYENQPRLARKKTETSETEDPKEPQ
jgi:hypothetical protein